MLRYLAIFLAVATSAFADDPAPPEILSPEKTAELFREIRENPPAFIGKEFAGQAWIETTTYEVWRLRTKSYAPSLQAGPAGSKAAILSDPLGMKAESAKFAILFASDELGTAAAKLQPGTLIEFGFEVKRESRRRIDGPIDPIIVAWIREFEVVAKPTPEETP